MNSRTLKTRIRIASSIALVAALTTGLTSCTEEEPEVPEEEETVQENPTPTIEAGSGTLVAVRSSTTQSTPIGDIDIPLNIAVSVFFDGTDYDSFITGGDVTCEGETLGVNPNNSYTLVPGVDNPSGMDISGDINWTVAGNGSVPAFSHEVGIDFPSVGDITSGTTVTLANGYTLAVQSLSGADSVIFMVGGELVTVPGNPTSHAFTADDLSSLSAGMSVAQVAAYKTELATYGGKDFYFVNETVETVSITLE